MIEKRNEKKRQKAYIIGALLILCVCVSLIACTKINKAEQPITESASDADEAKIISIAYDTPVSHPNIYVNQSGLALESTKYVLFSGNEQDTTFFVRDRETKEVVYEGRILPLADENYSYGIFTEFKKQGTYYIQTKTLGESYPFILGDEQILKDVFQRTLNRALVWEEGVPIKAEDIDALFPILFAYEFNPTVFLDASIYPQANQIPDVLDGMERIGESIIGQGVLEEDGVLHFEKAAFLAQLSFAYQKFDNSIAQRMKQGAIKEYQKAQEWNTKNPTEKANNEMIYLAAAQLYRTTGSWTYGNDAKEYGALVTTSNFNEAILLYADITYLSTRHSVDVAFCNIRMAAIQTTIVKAIEEKENMAFFQTNMQIEKMFLNYVRMKWMDGIAVSDTYTEYAMTVYDYVLGVNIEGKSLDDQVASESADDTFTNTKEYNSLFLILTSSILKKEPIE